MGNNLKKNTNKKFKLKKLFLLVLTKNKQTKFLKKILKTKKLLYKIYKIFLRNNKNISVQNFSISNKTISVLAFFFEKYRKTPKIKFILTNFCYIIDPIYIFYLLQLLYINKKSSQIFTYIFCLSSFFSFIYKYIFYNLYLLIRHFFLFLFVINWIYQRHAPFPLWAIE